jgi:hypothetical protein
MRHYLRGGNVEIPAWYANMLHRREEGVTWADISGQWPIPRFVTRTDRWYEHWEWTVERKPPKAG